MGRTSTIKTVALGGVSLIALGIGGTLAAPGVSIFSAAPGEDLTVAVPTGTLLLTDYLLRGLNNQYEGADVGAAITGTDVIITGPNDGANVTVTVNSLLHTAIGNSAATTAIDGIGGSTDFGNRVLSSQVVGSLPPGDTVAVTAASTTNFIGADLSSYLSGVVTVSDNTVAATVMVNDATNTLDGLPTSAAAPTTGSAVLSVDLTAPLVDATIVSAFSSVANVQQGVNAGTGFGSAASILGTNIQLLDDAGGPLVDATLALQGNSLQASYSGNSAANSVLNPNDPEYAGSVIVQNAQMNLEIGGDQTLVSAGVTDSNVDIRLTSLSDYQGVLTASGNTIGADTTGNDVANQIVFDSGISILGGTTPASLETDMAAEPFSVGTFTADLGILSAQGNIGTVLRSEIGPDADTVNIGASIASSLTGGTVAVADNAIDADVTGNAATNLISTDGPEFDARAAIASFQVNTDTPIAASVFGSKVGTSVLGAVSADAVVAVGGNSIGASATGNTANSRIAIDAEVLVASLYGLIEIDIDSDGNGDIDVAGTTGASPSGAFVANYQINGDGSIAASVTGSSVGALAASVTGSTVAVDGNAISASATGNAGTSAVDLSGVVGNASAGVGNLQISDTTVGAGLSDVQVAMAIGPVTGAIVSLSDNSLNATAIGNSGSNRLSATGFASLTLGDGTSAAPAYSGSVGQSSATAALALVSDQEFREDVGATIADGSQIVIDAAGITDSTIAANGNAMFAGATGNQVGNTLRINSVVLAPAGTGGDEEELLAALVNDQSNDDSSVTASITGYENGVGFDAASGSTLAVNGNSSIASADGSFAQNSLIVTGVSHMGIPATEDGGYAFILASTQTETGTDNEITASVSDHGIGLRGDSSADSTLVVSGNSQIAQARNNVAINTLNLGVDGDSQGFTGLVTSALLDNVQTANAPVTATISGGQIGIEQDSATGSGLTVSDNTTEALAAGNAADNRMQVAALNLTGGGSAAMADDFTVLNGQTNSGPITATVTNTAIGINAGLAGQSITGGSANVLSNTSSATGYGNSASNSLSIGTLPGSTLRAGVENVQGNSGTVTATISSLTVGITTAATTSAPTTVSGNTVSATAVGNSAVNTVSRSNY